MFDFTPIPAPGHGALPFRPAPSGIAVTPVAPGSRGEGPQARMDDGHGQPRLPIRGAANGIVPDRSGPAPVDADPLPGPAPAFQTSLLELERDLRRAIERLESRRTIAEAVRAFGPDPADCGSPCPCAQTPEKGPPIPDMPQPHRP